MLIFFFFLGPARSNSPFCGPSLVSNQPGTGSSETSHSAQRHHRPDTSGPDFYNPTGAQRKSGTSCERSIRDGQVPLGCSEHRQPQTELEHDSVLSKETTSHRVFFCSSENAS